MRVLHVHSGNLYGGVERILQTLACARAQCPAMDPSFALSFDGRLAEQLRACAVPLDVIGAIHARRMWEVRRVRQALSRLVDERRPDVVVVHSSWTQALLGPAIQRAGIPLVRWLHAPERGLAALEWAAARVPAALVICNSRYTCDASADRFPGTARRICYAPMTLPPPSTHERGRIRAALGTRDDAVVIAVAARLEPWKGHAVLLDALTILAADSRWHCWVIGGPQRKAEAEYLDRLHAQAGRAGLSDRMSFAGEREDVAELLGASDIYCQPNDGPEPFGISFVEALAAGLPVVATKLGALPEIVDERCGFLVEPGSPAEVASALGRLMDPQIRGAMGASAVKRASRFGNLGASLSAVADALESARTMVDDVSRQALR